MSDLLKAWYIFLILGLFTFLSITFIGEAPPQLSSKIALPHNLLVSIANNLRLNISAVLDRRNHQLEIAELSEELAASVSKTVSLNCSLRAFARF
ncbi:MAG: hypothetical protein R2880_14555 [Deinococcales bacterium]